MPARKRRSVQPSRRQRALLRDAARRGDARLPLFTADGQLVSPRIVADCVAKGWAEPWFDAAIDAGWTVCRLTDAGRAVCT